MAASDPHRRLALVELDEATIGRGTPDQDHERAVAIHDLIEENHFEPVGDGRGPYRLGITLVDGRLVFDIRTLEGEAVMTHILSLTPFRRIIRDYFLICDSYYQAIRTGSHAQIETIDMARRGVHDEGSTILRERLAGKVVVDHQTARRLFTLVAVLHWKA